MQETTISPLLQIIPYAGMAISLILVGLLIASSWKVFTKAGQPGWASLIPIYNTVVLLEITEKPTWWFILFLIPGVNLIVSIVLTFALATAFNKSAMFGVGLLFLGIIFFPILAFGDAEYRGTAPARA